jgi:outer membrane receptor protein involved in Fe transport
MRRSGWQRAIWLALFCGFAAHAEDPAPADAPPPEASQPQPYPDTVPVPPPAEAKPAAENAPDKTQLEEVIVTATKREQSLRKIPSTIHAISGEDLEKMGARELQDYLKLIPGITLQEGDNDTSRTISIRGIGPQSGGLIINNQNATTGVLLDDVSLTDPYGSFLIPDLDPFDLHDLEVLKGPQGTLFGAGALNGAIRYVLNKPKLGATEVKGFANYVKLSQGGAGVSYGAAVNLPAGETLAFRLMGMIQRTPGLYDDINGNGKHDIDADTGGKNMWRAMGTWRPLDKLTINAFFLRQQNHRDDLSIANKNAEAAGYGKFARTITPGPSTSRQEFEVGNLDLRYELPWFTVISETSMSKKYQDVNYDGSAVAAPAAEQGVESLRFRSNADTLALSQELRLASNNAADSNWVWLGGGYINRYKATVFFNTVVSNSELLASIFGPGGVIPGLPLPIVLFPNQDGLSAQNITYDPLRATEASLFGELTHKFFERKLEVTLGARAYREWLTVDPKTEGADGAYGDYIGAGDPQNQKAAGLSPKGSIKMQWTKNLLTYATVARGFQFGGVNGPAPIPTDNVFSLSFRPSTIWSYEAGVRTDWLAKTLQFDLTGFYIDWSDMQLRQDVPSGNTDYIANVGKARSIGLESALRWLTPIPGVLLTNSAAYIRAQVQESYTNESGVEVQKGTELPASPHWSTSTSLAYTKYIGTFSAGANVALSYIGGAYNNVAHEVRIFNYGVLDAGLVFGAPQWKLAPELGVNVSNVLDRRGIVGARYLRLPGQSDPADEVIVYTKPRAIVARLALHF